MGRSFFSLLLLSAFALLLGCGGTPEASGRSELLPVGRGQLAESGISFGQTASFDESASKQSEIRGAASGRVYSGLSGLRTDSADLQARTTRRKRRGY